MCKLGFMNEDLEVYENRECGKFREKVVGNLKTFIDKHCAQECPERHILLWYVHRISILPENKTFGIVNFHYGVQCFVEFLQGGMDEQDFQKELREIEHPMHYA